MKSLLRIHDMVQSQEIGTNASIEESRIHIKHWFVMLTFSETQHFCFNLSTYITFKEYKRSKDVGLLAKKCGFQVRISYVLSCVHEQAILLNKGIPIHLNSIDKFWRKLDFFFSCTSLEDDDFGCEAKVNMHKEQFKTQPTEHNHAINNIVTRSCCYQNTCGRPSSKNKLFRKSHADPLSKPNKQRMRYCSPLN
uniref:L27 domain-containing protein n=1 Tax=Lactuca sativa TaxID=4236 RepID=A0A9R1V581_LACSA|nr:hypothetical protein LSAT_V11C700364550 [Lactuca sativa]